MMRELLLTMLAFVLVACLLAPDSVELKDPWPIHPQSGWGWDFLPESMLVQSGCHIEQVTDINGETREVHCGSPIQLR